MCKDPLDSKEIADSKEIMASKAKLEYKDIKDHKVFVQMVKWVTTDLKAMSGSLDIQVTLDLLV